MNQELEPEEECNHEGYVMGDECENCGEIGLESDESIYNKEAPR